MGLISVALLNHENTKKLEIHEIFDSRISRILIESTEKSILRSDLLSSLYFSWFSFSFRVFVIQYEA